MRTLIILGCWLLLLNNAWGRLYKWVDENGHVYYSDKLPPSAVKKPHAVLNKQGVVVKRTGRAKTAEEIAREEELKRLREKQQRMMEMQKARDKVLLSTFRSEDDIIMARDGQLATYDAQIRISYNNIERLKSWLEVQKKRAAALERKGRKVPKKMLAEIENTRRQIKANYESIIRQEEAKKLLREKYAADLQRFRELKAIKTARVEERKKSTRTRSDAIVETVIVCDGTIDCEQAWRKAKDYARRHATTRTYVDTAKMFMTQPPKRKEDLSIAVSRLRPEENKAEIIFLDVACKKEKINDTWCENEKSWEIRKGFRKFVLGAKAAQTSVAKK